MTQDKALQALHDENERLGLYEEAYAQPEPVAWMYQEYRDDDQFGWRDEIQFVQPPNDPNYFRNIVPVYTTPPQRTEQEPVAWIHNFIEGGISIGKRPADLNRHPDRWTALYKEPKPCPTCEALARTVMLDQTSHDTTPSQRKEPPDWFYAVENILNEYGLQAIDFVADFKAAMKDAEHSQRTWVGLTSDEIANMFDDWPFKAEEFARAIEAKLKELNT